jgi:hypothetical protein
MRNLLTNSLKVCAIVLSSLLSVQATAQTVQQSQLNCPVPNGTSKDLSVVDVFVDAPACATCTGGSATYPLKMTIHNGTKSDRTAFALFGTLSAGATLNGFSGNIVVCVGEITVHSDDDIGFGLGNQTFTVGTITFSCTTDLQLTNNVLAWTDAAGETPERCAAFFAAKLCKDVQPKCDVAASINIRQPLSFSSSQSTSCSNSATGSVTVTPIGGTSPWDIVIDGTAYNNVTVNATKSPLAAGTINFTITDDAGCTVSGSQVVSSQFCCTSPTIDANPTSTAACPEGTASFTASSTGGDPPPTVQWWKKGPSDGAFSTVTNGAVYSGATSGTLNISDLTGLNGYQYQAVFTSAGCPAATSTAATLTVHAAPVNPDVTYIAPLCDETTFSLKIGSVANPILLGAKYTVLDKNGDPIPGISPASPYTATAQDVTANEIIFSDIPAGSGYSVSIESSNGCVPSGAALPCGEADEEEEETRKAPSTLSQNVETQTTVKAYPNPFSDRIKFVVNSSVGGNGVLDVYNMTGQKVKTVHQGYIAAGTQTFELSLPTQQVANLVYVLRIGDKKMTGKLLQINK